MTAAATGPGSRMSSQARRVQLLEVGADLFRDSDYDEVWIEEVARRAGISRGLLYHYFPTKRAYFLAVLDWNATQMQIPEAPEPGLTAEEQVRDNVRRYLDLVSPRSSAYLTAHRLRLTDTEIGAMVDGHLRGQEERTLARVMSAMDASPDSAPEPARLAVHGWMECMVVQVITWLESPEPGRMPQEALVELAARTLESALLHAFEVAGQPQGSRPAAVTTTDAASHATGLDVGVRMSPEARREHLLAVGADLFAHADYDEVWIDEVARRAGISRGLLYHYFSTKRDFYLAVLRYRGDRLLAAYDEVEALSPDEQLRTGLRSYLAHVRSGPLSYRHAVDRRHEDPEVGSVVGETMTRVETQMLDRVMAAAGGGSAPEPVVLAVRGWQTFVHTLSTRWMDGGTTPAEDVVELLARTLEDMLDTAFQFVAPQQGEPVGAS